MLTHCFWMKTKQIIFSCTDDVIKWLCFFSSSQFREWNRWSNSSQTQRIDGCSSFANHQTRSPISRSITSTWNNEMRLKSNSKKTLASSSSTTNGHNGNRHSAAHQIAAHVIASSSSFDNGIEHSSNSNSPIPTATNGHHLPRVSYSERSQIPPRLTPKGPPLKTLKREPKYFPNPSLK